MKNGLSRKIVSIALSVVLAVGLCPGLAAAKSDSAAPELAGAATPATATTGALTAASSDLGAAAPALEGQAASKVKKYSYSARPILAPFNWALYVKTTNPDPKSFRLVDKKSKYLNKGDDPAEYQVLERNYVDVKYMKAKTYRVKGGYIFYCYNVNSDGGVLQVQQLNADGTYSDTGKTVKVPALKDSLDYLIDTYAKGKTGFFNKLAGVEAGLYALSVYPRAVYDSKKPNKKNGWPVLAASPYPELSLNDHYENLYARSESGSFLENLHPYVLDSLGFPGMMASAAKTLNPKCTVTRGDMHWEIKVTYNGESHIYGWAGEGGSGPLYSNTLGKLFKFNGDADDLAFKATAEDLSNRYLEALRNSDKQLDKYKSMIQGAEFYKAIGKGCWARIAREMGGGSYAYIMGSEDGTRAYAVSSAWVDGRYVDEHECIVLGAKFSDYPQADIIVRNKTFTDAWGTQHTCDLRYYYESASGDWRASGSEYGYYDGELPGAFILTAAQVKALGVDKNANHIPASGKVYDGAKKPGSAFKNTLVTGISVPKTVTAYVGGSTTPTATVQPSNATMKEVTWKSLDESVATIGYDGSVVGVKTGTTKLVATTVDGAFTATCTVKVKNPASLEKAKIGKIAPKLFKKNKVIEPKPVVKLGKKRLVLNKDYTLSYSGTTYPGMATVTVTGINAYQGSVSKQFLIYQKVKKPKARSFTYNGEWRYPIVGNGCYYADYESGTSYAMYPGTYKVVVKLSEGYRWADGSTKPLKLTWKIKKRTVKKPKARNFTYDGKKHRGVKAGKYYSLYGEVAARKAGTYKVIVTPAYGCQWPNKSSRDLTLTWKIKRK